MTFLVTDYCRLDANGRLKLPPDIISGFESFGSRHIVLQCWSEGSLALIPKSSWERMYRELGYHSSSMIASFEGRQKQRLFTRFTLFTEITAQGRITIPQALRERAKLILGEKLVLSGLGECVEVWNLDLFEQNSLELNEKEEQTLLQEKSDFMT